MRSHRQRRTRPIRSSQFGSTTSRQARARLAKCCSRRYRREPRGPAPPKMTRRRVSSSSVSRSNTGTSRPLRHRRNGGRPAAGARGHRPEMRRRHRGARLLHCAEHRFERNHNAAFSSSSSSSSLPPCPVVNTCSPCLEHGAEARVIANSTRGRRLGQRNALGSGASARASARCSWAGSLRRLWLGIACSSTSRVKRRRASLRRG